MPTKEQIDTVVEHIKDIIGRNYIEGDGDMCSCWFQPEGGGAVGMTVFEGVPVGIPEPFKDLPDKAKIELLQTYVDWKGFDDAQEFDAIQRIIDGEGADFWMDGIAVSDVRPPNSERKPPNHGSYQVWYGGKTHACDVESVSARDVAKLTKQPPDQWKDRPDVTVRIDSPRPIGLGDVIVDPELGAWEVEEYGFVYVTPPEPIAAHMATEGIEPPLMKRLRESVEAVKALGLGDLLPSHKQGFLADGQETDDEAARVRDSRSEDAATHKQRVTDDAATVRHLEPEPPPVGTPGSDPAIPRSSPSVPERQPSPSEIAEDNRPYVPEPTHGRDKGRGK